MTVAKWFEFYSLYLLNFWTDIDFVGGCFWLYFLQLLGLIEMKNNHSTIRFYPWILNILKLLYLYSILNIQIEVLSQSFLESLIQKNLQTQTNTIIQFPRIFDRHTISFPNNKIIILNPYSLVLELLHWTSLKHIQASKFISVWNKFESSFKCF